LSPIALIGGFPVAPVEPHDFHVREIHAFNASEVDVNFVRIGTRHVEGRDAARRTEMMPRRAGVESIRRDIVRRRQKPESFGRDDPMQISFFRAYRAVALFDFRRRADDFELDTPAVTSTAEDLLWLVAIHEASLHVCIVNIAPGKSRTYRSLRKP